ncbi:hypothetical protein ACFXTO_021802 [Malus domestica]
MMPLGFGKLSSRKKLVLKGLTKSIRMAYATIMEERGKERITHLIPVKNHLIYSRCRRSSWMPISIFQ